MKKIKKSKNAGTITIVQLLTLIIGLIFVWTIIGLPIAIVLIFLEGLMVEKEYSCPKCGNVVAQNGNKCYTCNAVLE